MVVAQSAQRGVVSTVHTSDALPLSPQRGVPPTPPRSAQVPVLRGGDPDIPYPPLEIESLLSPRLAIYFSHQPVIHSARGRPIRHKLEPLSQSGYSPSLMRPAPLSSRSSLRGCVMSRQWTPDGDLRLLESRQLEPSKLPHREPDRPPTVTRRLVTPPPTPSDDLLRQGWRQHGQRPSRSSLGFAGSPAKLPATPRAQLCSPPRKRQMPAPMTPRGRPCDGPSPQTIRAAQGYAAGSGSPGAQLFDGRSLFTREGTESRKLPPW